LKGEKRGTQMNNMKGNLHVIGWMFFLVSTILRPERASVV
jgi:hypothetical protein